MEFKKFKKFNYLNVPKKFCNHFHYICLYYRHTHYGISQRQHVLSVYLIHSNCGRLYNSFSLWWTMVKVAIYSQKCEQNDWKLIKEGIGMKMSWVEKNRKINNRWGAEGGGEIIRDSRVFSLLHFIVISFLTFWLS